MGSAGVQMWQDPVPSPAKVVDQSISSQTAERRAVMNRASEISAEGLESAKSPTGILLTRDLIFRSKVTGTAENLGCRVLTAGDTESALGLIDRWQPRVLFLDLTAEKLTASDSLQVYREHTGPDTTFLAFGPHVDTSELARARNAGCHRVLSRGEFSAQLPKLIRELLLGR